MGSLLQSAHWPFLIDVYFFLGGLAGGAFVIATAALIVDATRYRDVSRVGYYSALVALVPCPVILIIDLGVPTRFMNMVMTFNPNSPMSMGAWALLGFSAAAFLAALFTLLEDLGKVRDLSSPKIVVGLLGGFMGFFLAAYPGVLLGATARPLWINAHTLGALFLAVGASSGAAAMALVLAALRRRSRDSMARLTTTTVLALLLQLLAIIGFVWSIHSSGSTPALNALALITSGQYSMLFWGGAIVAGSVLPILLGLVAMKRPSVGLTAVVSVLVLVGGFLVKTLIMAAGQV
jgi:formate-dependent nitrite reductase membrane component NrfD